MILSFTMSGGLVMLKPSIVSATWTSHRGRPVRASRQMSAASFVPTNNRWPRIARPAVDHVRFARVADLLRTGEPPDLTSGTRVHRGHRARTAAARAVHDAVNDERRALAHRVAWNRRRPRGAKPRHVRRIDALERGIVRALVVAPGTSASCEAPLSALQEPLVRDAPRDRRRGGSLVRSRPCCAEGTRRGS